MIHEQYITAIIPARMGSTRFPGKPLKEILGLPMIEHIRRRAILSGLFEKVVVATCDKEILNLVEGFGGLAVMTKSSHERCTDRIEEAANFINSPIIVNIQGDEPIVSADSLKSLVQPLLDNPNLLVSNIVNPIEDSEELNSKNVVKVVLSNSLKILYMSRAAIPGNEKNDRVRYYKQTGLMAFRKEFLHRYSELAPTPLEIQESCDMLRLLEHDFSIQAVISSDKTIGVDVPEQISIVEEIIMNDPLQRAIFDHIKENPNPLSSALNRDH